MLGWQSAGLVPASWMPLVVEAIHAKNRKTPTHQDTIVPYASNHYPSSIRFKLKRWHADRSGQTPILHGSTNAAWLTLCPESFVHLFRTLYEGLLADVYYQKVVTACRYESASQSVIVQLGAS